MKSIFKKIITYILQAEARLVIYKYKPRIIAITGSVGKTSTKDAVYAVLCGVSHVRKSDKSYNSEIGLPLTILGIPNAWSDPFAWFVNIFKGLWLFLAPHKYPLWLVLEVGVGKPGDMDRTAKFLQTDVVVITAIGDTPAHIEFFGSRKNLIEEKSKLIKTLKPDGLLVLNGDDSDVINMKAGNKHRTLTYGFGEASDVRGSADNIFYDDKKTPTGIVFRVNEEGKSLPVFIEGVFGRNHVYASLAALTIASGLKLNMLSAIDALKNYEVSPGRMRLLLGIKGSSLIDDTYNSSPFACKSALKTLKEVEYSSRKIAVLGDMLELGRHTEEAHRDVGILANDCVEVLVVVGQRAKAIKQGAIDAGMNIANIHEFLDSHQAGEFMQSFVEAGDLVLIKGSQGMRMERVTAQLLSDQQNKETLLVRQDTEWQNKK